MRREVLGMSERFACRVVGLTRSTYRRLPAAQTLADPDAGVRAWLRAYATKNPCHGFRRAWSVLRFDEGHRVNVKRVHRLWRSEGLQVQAHPPRKRAGISSIPPVEADAPNVVWALDFQFDSTVDGRAVKIASMVDEHTRESLLHLVERSITGEKLVAELERVFAARGRRGYCGWTTDRKWFRKRCNLFAETGSGFRISRRAHRGTTGSSSRSTRVCVSSASTGITGRACSRLGW